MKCPRRVEGPFKFNDGEDTYRADNTCSYCGSFNADELIKRIEAGTVELGPTDKDYKIYLENKNGENFLFRYRDCPPNADCKGPDDCTHWATEERSHSKFYFQHLSEEQMRRFVDLYNEKKLKIGMPGHFYVSPFFMQRAK